MSALTQAELDLLAGFRFRLPDDQARIQAAIDALQAQIDLWALVDGSYAKGQAIFMERQDASLQAKAAALAAADPDPDHDGSPNTYEVEYGGTHPSNAGIVPTDWKVQYLTPYVAWSTGAPFDAAPYGGAAAVVSADCGTTFVEGVDYSHAGDILTNLGGLPGSVFVVVAVPVEVVVYSHSVAWDSNQGILDDEAGWLDYYRLRTHAVWGSAGKAAKLGAGMANLLAWQSLLGDREDAAVRLGDVPKYLDWDRAKDDSVVTPRASSTLHLAAGEASYAEGLDYTVLLTGDGRTILGRVGDKPEDDPMQAVVRITAD